MNSLDARLNEILPKVISDSFLSGSGLGNEIAFHIFDYPPASELKIREHIGFLLEHIPKKKPGLRVRHISLFDFTLDYLTRKNLLDKAFKMQREKGDEVLLKNLEKLLHPNNIAGDLADAIDPEHHDLVLISGIGGVFPFMRAHSLLNNLHSRMGQTPVVLFYPGHYDGQALRLFGKLHSDNYYRAFKLIP